MSDKAQYEQPPMVLPFGRAKVRELEAENARLRAQLATAREGLRTMADEDNFTWHSVDGMDAYEWRGAEMNDGNWAHTPWDYAASVLRQMGDE